MNNSNTYHEEYKSNEIHCTTNIRDSLEFQMKLYKIEKIGNRLKSRLKNEEKKTKRKINANENGDREKFKRAFEMQNMTISFRMDIYYAM